MTQSSYREHDYDFGQLMLTLRTAIGLTQEKLADFLGVSRRTVGSWESGSKYPKPDHLMQFITLAFEHQVFPTGREAEQIRALWQGSRQKALLDEAWLASLLSLQPQPPTTRVDWGDALNVQTFYGREWELNLLTEWVVAEQCRVITILGLGGMGKSTLAVKLMHQLVANFEVVIWRSLRDIPTCEVLLDDLLQVLGPQAPGQASATIEQRLAILMEYMRSRRILLVLDNLESMLEEEAGTGRTRPGYEGFGRFMHQSAVTNHQSCVLLTSREKPADLLLHEGSRAPVRALRLARLDPVACAALLAERDITGSPTDQARLIEAYAGSPLALKIVAHTIVALFDGEIAPFLEQGGMIFGSIHDLLHEQYARLAPLEQSIVFWLAIMREPVTLNQLRNLFVLPHPAGKLLEAVDSLHRRSLIERGQSSGSFTLQSVVLDYITEQFIAEAGAEIYRGELRLLIQHGLEQAYLSDYVRATQTRLLTVPLLTSMQSLSYGHLDIESQLYRLLDRLRESGADTQGYGPANLVALLRLLRGDLRGVDLSRLTLRGVYFQGIEMQNARLTDALIQNCDFTETFDGIISFTISDNGQYWVASSEAGAVRLWEASGHILHRIWQGPADIIYRFALSPDGQNLAGGYWDGTIKLWDIATGVLLWTASWPRALSEVYHIVFSPDGSTLTCTGDDANIRLLDARTGRQIQIISQPQRTMVLAWHPDGERLAAGDTEGTIRLWLVSKAEPASCIQVLTGHTQNVYGLAFSPDGHVLASASSDTAVKLWDTNTGNLHQTLTAHRDWVLLVRWSPDGRTLASGGRDNLIWLWDVERNSYRAALRGHQAMVRGLAFTPDGHTLVSGSPDGTLRVWDAASGECMRVMQGYNDCLSDVDWSPDGQQLVSGSTDCTVTLYSLNNTPPRVLRGHKGNIFSVGWSPDGRWIASAERENALRLWDTQSGDCVEVLRHPDDNDNLFYNLAWSPDSQRLAVATARYDIMIWDRRTHRVFGTYEQPFPALISSTLAWNPDGTCIAGAGSDVVYIWNDEGRLLQTLTGHTQKVASVVWSADGQQLLSVSTSEIFRWDTQQGNYTSMLIRQQGIFVAVAYGASQNIAITGSSDGKLRWWDIDARECIWVRTAHQASIQALRISPDRTKLASCGDDGAITLWDLASGEYLQTVRRDRPYERMNITGIRGLTDSQKATLRALGAVEGPAS